MSAKASKVVQLCDHHPFPWGEPAPENAVPAATQPPDTVAERDEPPFPWVKPPPKEQSPYCRPETFFDREEPSLPSVGAEFKGLFANAIERDRRTSATRIYEYKFVYSVSHEMLLKFAAENYFQTLQLVRRYAEFDDGNKRTDEVNGYVASLPALAEPVYQKIQEGQTPENAINAVARETRTPVETVSLFWKMKEKRMAWSERAKRNRKIMRLAARGWTKAAIARHVGLSPNSIKAIVKRQLAAMAGAGHCLE